MNSSKKQVVVIGGGVLGVSTAAHLMKHQGLDVTLVTEDSCGDGASGRSLSWLNSFLKHSPAYHALRVEGMKKYREFAVTHDTSDYLHYSGGAYWPGVGDIGVEELSEHLNSVGYDVEVLSPSEVAERGLGLDPDALPEQVMFTAEDGWVDLPSLIRVLLEEFRATGGKLRENAGKAAVDIKDGCVVGVLLGDGSRLPADEVVVATGPAVPQMLREVGVEIPDRTPVSVLVRTEPIDHGLNVVVNSPHVAVRPNIDGNLVLDRGWAEAHVLGDAESGYSIPDWVVERLLHEASSLLVGHPELHAVSCGIGPKPIPGDGEPVVGELDNVQGYFVAFAHSGATLALVIGELLARELTGSSEELLSAFRPRRFVADQAAVTG